MVVVLNVELAEIFSDTAAKFVEVTEVPEAVANTRPEAVNPPDKIKLPAEVNLFAEEKNCISPVPPPP